MGVKVDIDAGEMLNAIARLKNVPLAKTVRNASRDFARAVKEATPIAQERRALYFRLVDDNGALIRYVPAAQVNRSKHSKRLKAVRINRGWSKCTWWGVFDSLGIANEMGPKPKGLSPVAAQALDTKSTARMQETQHTAEMTITDRLALDKFGKAPQNVALTDRMIDAGYARASAIMIKTYNDLMGNLWRGK